MNYSHDTHSGDTEVRIKSPAPSRRHGLMTRALHAGLAILVISQLVTSLVMPERVPGQTPDVRLTVHEYGGLVTLVFATFFLCAVFFRRKGTSAGQLFPWFSAQRRRALSADIRIHYESARKLRWPTYDERAALPSAIHGLGLLLMFAMASLGTIWFAGDLAGYREAAVLNFVLDVHKALANLVWAYLIGHASMAVLHHYTQGQSLKEMWSLRS